MHHDLKSADSQRHRQIGHVSQETPKIQLLDDVGRFLKWMYISYVVSRLFSLPVPPR